MNKKICSIFLALIMLFQMVPSFAADNIIDVTDEASFFSINENLNSEVNIVNDIYLKISDATIQKYGSDKIGSMENPFTGVIKGNNNTLYLDIYTSDNDYALFEFMKGVRIEKLNIVVQNFVSTSNESDVSFSVLANKMMNTNVSLSTYYNSNIGSELMFKDKPNRNITVAGVAKELEDSNYIYLTNFYLNLDDLPSNATVLAGATISSTGILSNSNNLDENFTMLSYRGEATGVVVLPANDNNYLVGGAMAKVVPSSYTYVYGNWNVLYKDFGFKSSNKKNSTTDVVLGGAVGQIDRKNNVPAIVEVVQGTNEVDVETLGVVDNLTMGGAVGINNGTLTVHNSTNNLSFENKNKLITFADDIAKNKNSVITMGGVLGKNNGGQFYAYSNGINTELQQIEVPKSTISLGSILGEYYALNSNTDSNYVILEDNGTSLMSPEIKANKGEFGFIIGKVNTSAINTLDIKYNIVNATDEKQFKTDFDWIGAPIGGISKNYSISGFKNNYWGYMDYAIINEPSQVYFTVPMDYYGNNPPEMNDSDYPFLGTYAYLNSSNENNQYLKFQNKTERGIGTLTLEKECLAAIKVTIKVVSDDAKAYWTGHYYRNDDVLNYKKIVEEDEDSGQDTEVPDSPKDDTDSGKDTGKDTGKKDDKTPGKTDKDSDESYCYDENGRTYYCNITRVEDVKVNEKYQDEEPDTCYDQNGYPYACTIIQSVSKEEVVTSDGTTQTRVYSEYYYYQYYQKHYVDKDGNFYDTIVQEDDPVRGVFQAIVEGRINTGKPLPTYNTMEDSSVLFNYFDLPYTIIQRNKDFSDIKGQIYKRDIIQAANRMIVEGYSDGTFGPDKNITRAEFATMIVRALGLVPSNNVKFTDVPKTAWYAETVNTAASWGIIEGIGNNLFAPERYITREEAATMLVRASVVILEANGFSMGDIKYENVYVKDMDSVSDWAKDFVLANAGKELIPNHGDVYDPLTYITRAETAHAILNLLRNYEVIDRVY